MDPSAPPFVQTEKLAAIPGLVHGFGQRSGAPVNGAVGRVPEGILLMKQVHGATVVPAPWTAEPEADAAVASRAGSLLGIKTADCLPVLVADPGRRAVAAAHAGWRGTVAGVVRAAVDALVREGSIARDLWAALGPGIGPCCYEVGDEVKAAFGDDGRAFFRPGARGRDHLDVRAANRAQLLASGLRPEHIDSIDHCTFCAAGLYHSYRRDGPRSGRMISFVGFR
jgi:YfiH family protein